MLKSRKMGSGNSARPKTFGETGMTMIELLIAMTVLTVGMLGSMIMVMTGMQSNWRNKNDTSAVVLDQEILEKFATVFDYPKPGAVPVTIYDCAPGGLHQAAIIEGASPTGNGATLYTTANAPTPSQVGDIDWTQATPPLATAAASGYAMRYQTCNGDVFEVRWNVMRMPACGSVAGAACITPTATSRISVLTVSSRQFSAQASHSGMLFSVPTTLRTQIEY